jgi:peptide/nickel transport system permease protein
MASGTFQIPEKLPWYAGPSLAKTFKSLRKYPIIPMAVLLLVLVLPAIFADFVAPYDPLEGQLSARLSPPFWMAGGTSDHWLGTDKQGRDILTRIIFGARISLMVSISAICIGGTIGTTLGLTAAYFGGWADAIIMRVVDTFLSMPLILLALVVVAVFGPSFFTVIGVVSSLLWVGYTRQVRGESLTIKSLDFVARARVAGASPHRIMSDISCRTW